MMIGDVVGDAGLAVLEEKLPALIKDNSADLVVVNGENSSGGFGITKETLGRILAAGADVVSGGNHSWEKREFWTVLDEEERTLRPANYPGASPGRGWTVIEKKAVSGGEAVSFVIINLQGREFMTPIDCPFRCFDEIFAVLARSREAKPSPLILLDFHAESTREKEALGFYLDGRVSLFAGTHTHIQTADERILPGGSAYITDLGMTGIAGSVLGMDTKICIDRALTQVLYRMELAGGPGAEVQGIIAGIDRDTGKAVSIKRIRV
jgi:metallophosphoesterase (TIGR00282 family)